jgi:hypothetical protein
MTLKSEEVPEVLVSGDPEYQTVDLEFVGSIGEAPRVIHLTRDEARRFAGLVLFQAARLDRPRLRWIRPSVSPERRSA